MRCMGPGRFLLPSIESSESRYPPFCALHLPRSAPEGRVVRQRCLTEPKGSWERHGWGLSLNNKLDPALHPAYS